MDNEQEAQVEAEEETEVEETSTEDTPTTDWEAEARKARAIAQRLRTKLTKATEKKIEPPKAEVPTQKPEDNGLLQKAFLRSAGIKTEKEIELALTTAKKWGMEVDALVDDEDFQAKLEKLRTTEANAAATSRIKGSPGTQSAVSTPAYWLAKGAPPTPADVPDRKVRAQIVREFMKNAGTSGKKFYND